MPNFQRLFIVYNTIIAEYCYLVKNFWIISKKGLSISKVRRYIIQVKQITSNSNHKK